MKTRETEDRSTAARRAAARQYAEALRKAAACADGYALACASDGIEGESIAAEVMSRLARQLEREATTGVHVTLPLEGGA